MEVSKLLVGVWLEVAGWGLTNPNQSIISDSLLTVGLEVIDDHTCEKTIDQKLYEIYGQELIHFSLHKTSFCAFGPMTGGKGACAVSQLYYIID